MASAADEIMDGVAEAYDELRKEFFIVNGVPSRCFLLIKAGETANYDLLEEIDIGWYATYETYRGQTLLKVARRDSKFLDAFLLATDFAIDSHIYEITQEDKAPPKQRQFYYQMFGTLQEGITYTPEE